MGPVAQASALSSVEVSLPVDNDYILEIKPFI